MNRQQRRKMERGFKKMGENSLVVSNPSFSILEEDLCSLDFQKVPIVYSGVKNERLTKQKMSPGLAFDNDVVRVVLTPEKEGVEITTIMVHPKYLSQGFGKLMMDFLLERMKKAGIDHISLYPQKKDPNDQISLAKCQKTLENFYSKRGFEWNKRKTEMVINWEKFEAYAENNQIIETLDFEGILNPMGGTGLMAA
jgi:N-acetylglutamate synthase-like GNAT family acetyltransferase